LSRSSERRLRVGSEMERGDRGRSKTPARRIPLGAIRRVKRRSSLGMKDMLKELHCVEPEYRLRESHELMKYGFVVNYDTSKHGEDCQSFANSCHHRHRHIRCESGHRNHPNSARSQNNINNRNRTDSTNTTHHNLRSRKSSSRGRDVKGFDSSTSKQNSTKTSSSNGSSHHNHNDHASAEQHRRKRANSRPRPQSKHANARSSYGQKLPDFNGVMAKRGEQLMRDWLERKKRRHQKRWGRPSAFQKQMSESEIFESKHNRNNNSYGGSTSGRGCGGSGYVNQYRDSGPELKHSLVHADVNHTYTNQNGHSSGSGSKPVGVSCFKIPLSTPNSARRANDAQKHTSLHNNSNNYTATTHTSINATIRRLSQLNPHKKTMRERRGSRDTASPPLVLASNVSSSGPYYEAQQAQAAQVHRNSSIHCHNSSGFRDSSRMSSASSLHSTNTRNTGAGSHKNGPLIVIPKNVGPNRVMTIRKLGRYKRKSPASTACNSGSGFGFGAVLNAEANDSANPGQHHFVAGNAEVKLVKDRFDERLVSTSDYTYSDSSYGHSNNVCRDSLHSINNSNTGSSTLATSANNGVMSVNRQHRNLKSYRIRRGTNVRKNKKRSNSNVKGSDGLGARSSQGRARRSSSVKMKLRGTRTGLPKPNSEARKKQNNSGNISVKTSGSGTCSSWYHRQSVVRMSSYS